MPASSSQASSGPLTVADAVSAAFAYLGTCERSSYEVRSYLNRKAPDDTVVEAALAELRALGHLDDARYARLFAQDKIALESWGSERIRRGLLNHGIDRELAEDTIAELCGGDEAARALEVLRRRFPPPAGDRRQRERALGVLLRKGYETEVALEALRRWEHDG